ncbi:hypothetical protein TrCOL_g717 [Triparma columacea]|uniref:Uncharacterized protein n=1 Tax=Triparma columacea TaxID=722753 RepID=A0A9W7G646_9STRA|nr:hypothetical protein TrCOL_g717 [Triparma columacea]
MSEDNSNKVNETVETPAAATPAAATPAAATPAAATPAAATPAAATPAAATPASTAEKAEPGGVGEAFSQTGKASGAVVKGTFDVTGQTLKGLGQGTARLFGGMKSDTKKD